MAVSTVQIANLALSNIGARNSIESLTEQSSEAKQCLLWYDFSRQATLAAYDWNFASKRLDLAEHSEAPPEGVWSYRYQYPADCIVAREIVNPLGPDADAVPYQIEIASDGTQKTILTDVEDAVLRYTFDIDTPSLFTPVFIEALSYHLAHHIAFSLTGKLNLKQEMTLEFARRLSSASAYDGNERVDRKPREAEWIRFRNYSGTTDDGNF